MSSELKKIDWNEASARGLIERINREILHPMGLAMCREPETGISPCLLVSDDGLFQYAEDMPESYAAILKRANAAEKDAARYRWIRDVAKMRLKPSEKPVCRTAEETDAAIDLELYSLTNTQNDII